MDSDISSTYRCIQEEFLHLNFKYLNTTFTPCKFISLKKKIKNKEKREKKLQVLVLNVEQNAASQFFNFHFTTALLHDYPCSATHTRILLLKYQQCCTTSTQWSACKHRN